MLLKIYVAQLNYCVGDMAGNARKIIAAARKAYADGARLGGALPFIGPSSGR